MIQDTMISIGDSSLGQNNLLKIVKDHKLFFQHNSISENSIKVNNEYYTELSEAIEQEFQDFENETVDSFFSPDNKNINENVDYLSHFGMIQINGEGDLWVIDQINNEWFAINPKANWCSKTEVYKL